MKCQKCGREITEDESHPFEGKVLCDDCYIKAISTEKECDPWATFLSAQERGGFWPKTTENLDEVEKKIYAFIRDSGRTTREGIATKFGLSLDDLEPKLDVLMHAELVKERREGDSVYVIPIPLTR